MSRAPAYLIAEDEEALPAQLPGALAMHRHVLVAGSVHVETDKVAGIAPALVDRIAGQPAVNAVIVEADGSRRLPFKAPASHEPVVPDSTSILVPVVGLDVLGKPLTPEHVHRPHIVAELTGATLGDPVTVEMVAATLAHPGGGAKGLRPGALLVPFLNKAEDEQSLNAAHRIAHLLLAQPSVDSVLIGAAENADPVREVWGRVGAVVLAAGRARRYGELKQLLPWHGIPLVAHVTAQALACADIQRVAVTLGAEATQVGAALAGYEVLQVTVEDWEQGQSRSVRTGLAALAAWPAAVLFLLADQPGISPALLSALIRCHRATLAPVVAPRYRGQRGNPVLFDRLTFPEFELLHGDIGARPILQAHRDEIAWVDWPTPEILQDIDTPSDYHPEAAGD
jgi:molybdenum cofactor cytidylyltransferase